MNANGRLQFENRLWKAQQGQCAICDEPLLRDFRFDGGDSWNLDHVYPRSRYARLGNRGNLTLTHIRCNTKKGDREPTGCQILMLLVVNAKLGHRLVDPNLRQWRCAEQGPTAIELAWEQHIRERAAQGRRAA